MSDEEVEKLRALLAYLDGWEASHRRWLQWIDRQWAMRLATFKAFRAKQQERLIDGILSELRFDSDGRVTIAQARSRLARARFRKVQDAAMVAIVLRGRLLFGTKGTRDDAGIFIGNMNGDTKQMVSRALKDSFRAAQTATKQAEGIANAA